MYSYFLTVEADSDLDDIFEYSVRQWGENQADRYITQLQEAVLKLCENPKIAKCRTDLSKNTYSFPVQQHVVYFDLVDNSLIIWAIHHKNRLPYYELDLY